MYNCDLCNKEINASELTQIPSAEFQEAVRSGFNPFTTPVIDTSQVIAVSRAMGQSSADLFDGWRMMAFLNTSDWGLCSQCASTFYHTTGKWFGGKPLKYIEIEDESLEGAKAIVTAQIPKGQRIRVERVLVDGKPQTVTGSAETFDAAFAEAQHVVPSTAKILSRTKMSAPDVKRVTIEAFDMSSAKRQAEAQFKNARATNVTTTRLGRKGFLGIGKKPNLYEVEVHLLAVVEIAFKPRFKVSFGVGEQ